VSRLLFVFFIVASSAFGQSAIGITSGEDNRPVALASITWRSPGSDSIFSALSDSRGTFIIPAERFAGKPFLVVRIAAAGYQEAIDTVYSGTEKNVVIFSSAEALDEFVVTGQLDRTRLSDAVQKARIIDRQVIDAKGAVNLRDVLQNELNIRVSQDQVLGSGMSLQGLNGQNVKILIDGVPVIGRVDGEIDLSQINLATIERIEIIEGPSSVSYGSNALAGTINLITKKKLKHKVTGTVNSYCETVGNYNLDATAAVNLKNSQLQLSGLRNYFDGWNPTDAFAELPEEKIADSGRFQLWKPKMQYQAGAKWIIPLKKFTITPYGEYFYERVTNRGYPRAPYYNSAFDDRYVTRRRNAGALFDGQISANWRVQGVLAYNFYERTKNTYLKNLNTLDSNLSISPTDHDTTEFKAMMSRASFVRKGPNKRVNFEAGYDINSETAYGQRIKEKEQTITETALFTNAEIIVKKLTLKPGLRATYNSAYKESFTPALNARYSEGKWTYRAGVASGFRSPGIKELYLDFVDINHNIAGNPDLKPEQSLHSQFWIVNSRKIGKNPFNIELNGYHQKVVDRITLAVDQTGVSYSYFNLDFFESTGGQLAFEYKPGESSFRIATALVGTRSNLTTDNFSFSPEILFNGLYNWKRAGVRFAVFYKYTGKVQTYLTAVDGTAYQSFISDYHLMDASVNRNFWNKRINLAAGVKNIFDVRSIGISNATQGAHSGGGSSTPIAWGRSAYIRLQITLESNK
jgi:outer membrane receptor for ferrienterochelin and colicins